MKNKIAILTQPLGNNYGGIIQNYALQKVLKDMGYEPLTIDRGEKKRYSDIRLILSYVKAIIYRSILNKSALTPSDRKAISQHTRVFIGEEIKISPLIQTTGDLAMYFEEQKFGAVVVGSDQTWRPKYSPAIFNFYLDFLSGNKMIQKIAYASSFGTAEWEYTVEETEKAKKLIQEFDAVSVRENSGVDLCRKYLDAEAVHVLDPTLLLTAEDYSQLIKKPKENKGLFTYVLDDSPQKMEFIRNSAQKLGLKYTSSQAKHKFDPAVKRPVSDYVLPPLENWLQGFRDAEFVITDSFHGTVFSIINQKPFLSLVNKARGASRFESFLGQLGLTDRLVYEVTDFDVKKLSESIDYEAVVSKLENLKSESISFLKSSLK